jgi:outer membrane lipoprotein-sorting protein
MRNSKSYLVARAAVFAGVFAAAIAVSNGGINQAAVAQAKPSVIAQMNAASAKFTSAQADLRQELFTKAVQDTETQTGQIYFLRKANATQMGMKMLPPDAKPGTPPVQIVEFKDGKLRVYDTGPNQLHEFSTAGKNQALADTFMTLGFGGSGNDLAKAWTIADLGTEQMSDGSRTVPVEKLDLVSRDAGIRNNYSHITIWVDAARGVSLKQVSFEASGGAPSGDTRTVVYTNIRINQPVNADPFAIKCQGKCN